MQISPSRRGLRQNNTVGVTVKNVAPVDRQDGIGWQLVNQQVVCETEPIVFTTEGISDYSTVVML